MSATVVSRPAPDRVVVDVGSKVLTSGGMLVPDPPLSFGAVWGYDDWDVVRLSEEHGVPFAHGAGAWGGSCSSVLPPTISSVFTTSFRRLAEPSDQTAVAVFLDGGQTVVRVGGSGGRPPS